MKTFFHMFVDSAKEFKNLRSLVTAALLIAVHTVLALFVSFQVTPSLRISLSFIANLMIGCLFGPVMGFVCGGVGDLIQFLIKPTGPYFIGWTISAALAGMIYGIFFYKKMPKMKATTGNVQEKRNKLDVSFLIRCILALTFDTVLINILLGTYWVNFMYGKGFFFYLTSRFIKNIMQLPINIFLTYYLLGMLRRIKK